MALHPNARAHWAARLRAQRTYQRQVADAIAIALDGRRPPRWTSATVSYTFRFRLNRRRDRDNLVAAMKCAQDCLQHCGIVRDDSDLRIGAITITTDASADRDSVTIHVRSDHAATVTTAER